MNIQIIDQSRLNDGSIFFVKLSNGRETIDFVKTNWYINVCVRNAMNKAFNRGIGGGNVFHDFDQEKVVNSYKKASIREMIRIAFELLKS